MRINRFVALASGLSRRSADRAIQQRLVLINGVPAEVGQMVNPNDLVTLEGKVLRAPSQSVSVLLNKPVGYVSSRNGQGSKTVYNLLPAEYQDLKLVGRLDKDSSGLILLTNDGKLANQLTHPRYAKHKVYEISLDRELSSSDKEKVSMGVKLEDGISQMQLTGKGKNWTITMSEGRNRQIRRTFGALDYKITKLHRIQFGPYQLSGVGVGKFRKLL